MSAEIDTLIPPLSGRIEKEPLREFLAVAQPGVDCETFERSWVVFEEMRERIGHPSRRAGGPCARIPGSVTMVPDPLPALGVD